MNMDGKKLRILPSVRYTVTDVANIYALLATVKKVVISSAPALGTEFHVSAIICNSMNLFIIWISL